MSDPCTAHPDVDWLFDELTPDVLARMRAEYQADHERARRMGSKTGMPRHDRTALLAMLDSTRIRTAAELGAQIGMTPNAVRRALMVARTRGAPVESISRGRIGGYRLIERTA